MYHVRIEKIFPCSELLSNNTWCCWLDAKINSLHLCRRKLTLCNLPTMYSSTIIHSREKLFLKSNHTVAQNDHHHKSIIQRAEKLRAIPNDLNLQFKVLKNKQEIMGDIQDERLAIRVNSGRRNGRLVRQMRSPIKLKNKKERRPRRNIRRLCIKYRRVTRRTAICHGLMEWLQRDVCGWGWDRELSSN